MRSWSWFSDKAAHALSKIVQRVDELYLVGGELRSVFLAIQRKRKPKPLPLGQDIDLTTPYSKERLQRLFPDSSFSPKNGETVVVMQGKMMIEITPFRGKDLEEDLKKRDFTINAIACPIYSDGADFGEVIDPTGGLHDLAWKVLRAWQLSSLDEDPLRMLRLFRFQAQLGFDIDSLTLHHTWVNRHKLRTVPSERILKELREILVGPHALPALRLMGAVRIMEALIPQIRDSLDHVHQDSHHTGETVYEHSLRVLANCPKTFVIRMAALLHDIGKAATFTSDRGGHYYAHEDVSVTLGRSIARALKIPGDETEEILKLIQHHMLPIDSRRGIHRVLIKEGKPFFRELTTFIEADKKAIDPSWTHTQSYRGWIERIRSALENQKKSKLHRSWCNGDHLIALGMKPNPAFSIILAKLILNAHDLMIRPRWAHQFLEEQLLFDRDYNQLHSSPPYTPLEIRDVRLIEYWDGAMIIGSLQSQREMRIEGPVMNYRYLTMERLNEHLKEGRTWLHFPHYDR